MLPERSRVVQFSGKCRKWFSTIDYRTQILEVWHIPSVNKAKHDSDALFPIIGKWLGWMAEESAKDQDSLQRNANSAAIAVASACDSANGHLPKAGLFRLMRLADAGCFRLIRNFCLAFQRLPFIQSVSGKGLQHLVRSRRPLLHTTGTLREPLENSGNSPGTLSRATPSGTLGSRNPLNPALPLQTLEPPGILTRGKLFHQRSMCHIHLKNRK